jgi:hypothetical protein
MRFILVFLLLISLNSFGQWKSYIISVRGDTLNRVDLNGKKQGPWVIHVEEMRGEQGFDEQGYFVDDVKDGLWVRFSLMGDKIAEQNYKWGSLHGRSRFYTRTGGLMREENWRAVDPKKTMDTVDVFDLKDPTKVIDRVAVNLTGLTYKHGTWKYFDPEWGTVLKTEQYFLDKLKSDQEEGVANVEDELKPLDVSTGKTAKAKSDTATKKALPKPQAILDYEKKNSKKKIKSRDGQTGL